MRRGSLRTFAGLATAAITLVAAAATGAAATTVSASDSASSPTLNPYNPSYGHPYRHGAVPNLAQYGKQKAWDAAHSRDSHASPNVTGPETLSYGGGIDGTGVTSGHAKVYLIFWGNQWGSSSTDSNGNLAFSSDSAGAAGVAQQFFKGIGTGNELWSAGLTQWCDGPNVASGATSCPANANFVPYMSGGVLSGVWYDNASAEPQTASGNQLGTEALAAAHHFGNTTAASNRYAYYVVLSPTGTNPDSYQGAYCAWHDYNGDTTLTGGAVSSDVGDFAFSNQPYNIDSGAGCGVGFVNSPGTTDGYSITLGHEFSETMSDQNPAGGWTNHQSGSSFNGQENGDECAWLTPGSAGGAGNVTFGSFGTYAMQSIWSNDDNACDLSHPIVNHGETVTVTNPGNKTTLVNTAVSLQISATDSAGKSLTYSATGLPAGLSISSSGLISGTPTTTGTSSVTVTATSGTASGSTSFTWTIASEVVTVTNPGSQNGVAGTAASLQISATDNAGKSLTFSASGLPAGLSISSSGLISGTPTTAGTSSVTVTASSGTASGSTSFSWTIQPAGSGGITNGGFETGNFTGWTTSGASETIVNSGAHSGTYAAKLGASTPTNGDSNAAQTFTVPSGNSTLSFWYNITCPDTLTYDWATATLKDNTANTTTTVLAKTCVSSSGWTKVSTSVVAGHSYTLTLTSHDDNYGADPTYTLYDDVALAASAANAITNGGFETGSYSGWTTSGAAHTIVSSGAHSGTYAAQLGATTPTNGDSSAAQTFTAASGDSTLSFWYNITCPDTVTYDWATVTLKDNTANTTTTVLAKTCASSSGWTRVSTAITAGHSYTVTLTSHDDNYGADPTFTLYDDVATS